eukprot:Skav221654  [mRNA]  locus=scaffold1750:80376:117791:+ [translate_table: standard]
MEPGRPQERFHGEAGGWLGAVLGEKHSKTLGIAEGGRDLRMQTVLKAVKEAFQIRAYGKALSDGHSPWGQIRRDGAASSRLLVRSGKKFYDLIMIKVRLEMVKYRSAAQRDHPWSREGTLGEGHPKGSPRRSTSPGPGPGTPPRQVSAWLKTRLNSALKSQQPLETTVELVQQAKEPTAEPVTAASGFVDFPDVDGGKIVRSMQPALIQKCHSAIMSNSIPPAHVNKVGLFQKILGKSFDQALFESLKPSYEEHRAMLTEWLVAYCEHTGVELPPYCMNANQKEAFDQLHKAIEASATEVEELKKAVIFAKTVPDLKSHKELSPRERRARSAALPSVDDLNASAARRSPGELVLRPVGWGSGWVVGLGRKRWTRDRKTRGDGEAIADSFEVIRVTEVRPIVHGAVAGMEWPRDDGFLAAQGLLMQLGDRLQGCWLVVSVAPAAGPISRFLEYEAPAPMKEALGHEIVSACRLSPLDPRATASRCQGCNEFLFFHGVKPQVADLIAENHFDISFASKDGMFGAGLYFAEASSKSDEYCQPNEKDEYPIIIVRVILGRPNYVDAPKPFDDPGRRALEHSCMSGSCHSVIGDRIKVSNTYREMVLLLMLLISRWLDAARLFMTIFKLILISFCGIIGSDAAKYAADDYQESRRDHGRA